MTKREKDRLLYLEKQLSIVKSSFCAAQIHLEQKVEAHGMSSPEAGEASALCGLLTLRLSEIEEELTALKWKQQPHISLRIWRRAFFSSRETWA